jgi:hypothetical protein
MMSVTESDRHQLFAWFEEHMGKERAATMMSLLPPVGWADVATKRDLDALADRMRADMQELRADVQELRADLQRTFVTWLFASQGAVVAAIGLLFALTR